jgi:hypothetical protein
MGAFRKLGCCVFVLALACQGSSGDQDRSTIGEVLDPEAYRAEIQALENDLYYEPFDAGARDATALKLGDLADKVASHDGAVPMLCAVEMRQLAALAKMGKNARFVRTNWERIRCNAFDDAVWYRWRNAPQRPQAASVIDMGGNDALKREYARVLEKLDAMVVRGRRDVERLGEPRQTTTDYFKGDYRKLVEEWEEWAEDWNARLSSIEGDIPDQPDYKENAALRFAHQALSNAIGELYTVPLGRGAWKTPFRNQWENRFRRAQEQLDKARYQLEK